MFWRGAAILVAMVLAVPLPVNADWLMVGGDAQQTGRAGDVGLDWPDVALNVVTPPFSASYGSTPLIVADAVYLAIRDSRQVLPIQLWRIDLSNGTLRTVLATGTSNDDLTLGFVVQDQTPQLASDGRNVYVVSGGQIWSYDSVTGAHSGPIVFSAPGTGVNDDIDTTCCLGQNRVIWSDGLLYIAQSRSFSDAQRLPRLYVVDPAAGTARGPWMPGVAPSAPSVTPSVPPTVESGPLPPLDDAAKGSLQVDGLAVSGTKAVVTLSSNLGNDLSGTEVAPDNPDFRLWVVDTSQDPPSQAWEWSTTANSLPGGTRVQSAPSIVVGNRIFEKDRWLHVLDLANGTQLGVNDAFADAADVGGGMAYANGRLFAAIGGHIQAFRSAHDNLLKVWSKPAEADGLLFQRTSLVTLGDAVIGLANRGLFATSTLFAFNATNGGRLWSYDLPGRAKYIAAGGGLVVAASVKGETNDQPGYITVLGHLPISLDPRPRASTLYPIPGESVELDLSDTPPSAHGQVTRLRVDWGDGSISDWAETTKVHHVYRTAGEAVARIEVGNDADQTSSILMTFRVGAHDPAVNILNSPFTQEYQNTSFFILGLLGTAAVALFGIARAGRKRRLFHRELRDLDADFKRLRDDAPAAEDMLNERRSHARELFLERKLDEAHSSFLVSRIDELQRRLRVAAVDDRLGFLPYRMVQRLKALLQDGRVDALEHSTFLEALEHTDGLAREQKVAVRKLIDSWFMRDAETGT